ncbi:BhlA/UviB family holin-like peptide [Chengkuizengella sp. SCS-71B]
MLRRVERLELNIIQYFLTQGPFAVLFVWLLIYHFLRGERFGKYNI